MGADVNAAGVAKNMPNFVRQIQRERMGRSATAASQQPAANPQQFQQLLNKVSPDDQEQNAAPAPGALQKEGGQERGRQRNVGQGETQGRPGQSSQVPGTEEDQQRRQMR
jgi:hypothetical protein